MGKWNIKGYIVLINYTHLGITANKVVSSINRTNYSGITIHTYFAIFTHHYSLITVTLSCVLQIAKNLIMKIAQA